MSIHHILWEMCFMMLIVMVRIRWARIISYCVCITHYTTPGFGIERSKLHGIHCYSFLFFNSFLFFSQIHKGIDDTLRQTAIWYYDGKLQKKTTDVQLKCNLYCTIDQVGSGSTFFLHFLFYSRFFIDLCYPELMEWVGQVFFSPVYVTVKAAFQVCEGD